MKRLEGEVLEALASLSPQGRFAEYQLKTIDPHQFLGLEVNPRAAAIAELVLWIGFLQWHFRTRGGVPPEPILKDFKTIKCMDAVLAWDAKELARDERGRPLERTDGEGRRVEVGATRTEAPRMAGGGLYSRKSAISAARIFGPASVRAMRKPSGPRILT